MKNALLIVLLVTGFFAFESPAQMAIRWKGSAGWGIGSKYESQFNNINLQVINGTIYRIDTVTPMSGMSYGIKLTVRSSAQEEFTVHLGPAWYILCQDMNLGLNDKVEIRGARFSLNGKPVMAAFELRTPDRILMLRDQDGLPYWSGWRKRKI